MSRAVPPALLPALLILSGPPGAGKTTIARAMADASDVPAVHLHTDDFFNAIRSGFIDPEQREGSERASVRISTCPLRRFATLAPPLP